jgi:hypothetical protein
MMSIKASRIAQATISTTTTSLRKKARADADWLGAPEDSGFKFIAIDCATFLKEWASKASRKAGLPSGAVRQDRHLKWPVNDSKPVMMNNLVASKIISAIDFLRPLNLRHWYRL